MNKAIIQGNVGAEPELRYTQSQKAVTQLRVATSEYKQGGEQTTTWHSVVVWEKLAESVCENVRKGTPVLVEGRLQNREFEGKDGSKQVRTEIVAYTVRWFAQKPRDDAGGGGGGGGGGTKRRDERATQRYTGGGGGAPQQGGRDHDAPVGNPDDIPF